MEEAMTTLLRSQAALQGAVQELCDLALNPDPHGCRSRHDLNKMTADDDVEAFLEVFERAARHEGRPPEDWARVLAPLLTGEAQRAYQDLAPRDADNYALLRHAILSGQEYSLPARAQRFHAWRYNPALPARPQVAALFRLGRRWLEEGDEPGITKRVVVDRCVRALPPDAMRYAAQTAHNTVEGLVSLLENHQVTQEMCRAPRGCAALNPRQDAPYPSPPRQRGRNRGPGAPMDHPPRGERPATERWPVLDRNSRRCFTCNRPVGKAGWPMTGKIPP
ncbi:hypothetical protein N1851_014481 [Merluccius polli]|uniref:SCAN box domain-containing protein n=1 Tax=Merluccius polli TaxID=89951 RepID=A0AA47MTF3_MERPO|nr:hypothetical protein N1851_014481 [Merluccius polli]